MVKQTSFRILFVLTVILAFTAADFEDIITEIYRTSTAIDEFSDPLHSYSTEGGAYIYIQGSGFSTRSPLDNQVTIGNVPCSVVEFLTTPTQVVCQTLPTSSEVSVQLKVVVDGKRVSQCKTNCYFKAQEGNTPKLTYMLPNAANPQDEIFYSGVQRVQSTAEVDYVKIGGFRCDASSQTEFEDQDFGYNEEARAPCNVPNIEAGYYQVTQRNMKNSGFAKKLNTVPVYRMNGESYDFAIAPRIDSISNNKGSSEGQIITVRGAGFSSTGQNEVKLGDTNCKILQQSTTEIQCELQPRSGPVPAQGYHSGLKYEFYKDKLIEEVKSGVAGSPTWVKVRLNAEILFNFDDSYTSKLSGYFKAPVTGNYKFVVTADERAELYLSQTPLVKTGLTKIVDHSEISPYRFAQANVPFTQVSNDISLTAGNYYYMELYHYEYLSGDYATVGVYVPNTPNIVSVRPEIQSVKVNCPNIAEVIEFRLTNVDSGTWAIAFGAGKTNNFNYDVQVNDIRNQLGWKAGLQSSITKQLYKADGSSTTNPAEAKTFVYTVTLLTPRTTSLPTIDSSGLRGTNLSTRVTQINPPKPSVSGTFSISKNGKTVQFTHDMGEFDFYKKMKELGFQDPIRVSRTGDPRLGSEWRIQFVGEADAAVSPLTITQQSLSGCDSPANVRVVVSTIQESSQELFYDVIPVDYLFTADDDPQITVKSNGIVGTCPNFNCKYIPQETGLPEVTSFTYSGSTLSMSIANVNTGDYTTNKIRVFFGNIECTVSSYTDSASPVNLVANCPNLEAGNFFPKVHLEGLGYAKVSSSLSATSLNPTISNMSPTQVNPNGGTLLTITGTNYPASISVAQLRGLSVKVGTVDCTLISVTPTQIQCITKPVGAAASLVITLNGKTITSGSQLTLLSTVPTISGVNPNALNPVLQTDITITGTNFDSTTATTKVFLQSTTSATSQPLECLVSSTSTTQIRCKLLGAATDSYNLYARTSAGYSNSMSVQVKTAITSVSPSTGSAAGGTILTILGGTFSNLMQQTLVFVGNGDVQCDVITTSANQITCKTRPRAASYAETPQDVVVATRIVEETVCQGGAGACQFTYLDSLTPQVTAFSATTVSPTSTLVITGTGFESNPSGTPPTVTIAGLACTVTASNDTSISITVPANIIPNSVAILVVNVAGKGDAKINLATPTIKVYPAISSISPSTGSTAGVLVTLTGTGFLNGAIARVGGVLCEIRSLTSTSIVCKATTTGDVSLDYNDIKGVKCKSLCRVSFQAAQTPTITSVSPLSPSVATSFTLTVQGTQLNLGTAAVRLISQIDNTVFFTGTVTSSSATQVVASFSNVAAGTYSVEVASGANIASSTSTISVDVPLALNAPTSVQSSIAGGATLAVTGSGFFDNSQKEKNKVSVCGFPCEVTQSSPTSIQCKTPVFVNAAVKSLYSNIVTPSALSGVTWSDMKTESVLFDNAFTTIYTSNHSTNCQIGLDIGANLLAELTEVRYFPNPAITGSTLSGTVVEGSNDNTTYTNIATIDANAHDGWNTLNFASQNPPFRYRYFRVRGGSSTANCSLSELVFNGVVLSNNAATDLNTVDCKAKVLVNEKNQESSTAAVNYRQTQTAVLNSISPEMGTSAGGTTLTLTGTNFETDQTKIKVYIDDVECSVTGATSTQIICTTGAAPAISSRRSSIQSELKIWFSGRGYVVTNNIKYFYVDRWSDINTWGGITPPREGDSVSIPAGQTILLDVSPPKLKAIIIEGALIFEDTNIDLHCDYIIIRAGRMQIGTWEKPINNKISITLYGTKDTPQLPTYGNKVISMMEGILDIHGKPRSHTWTVLDRTANAQDTYVIVQGNVDWTAGEEIVIASTEHDHYQSERRTITSVVPNSPSAGLTRLNFADPLKFKHFGGRHTFDTKSIEMRAEVGLLTRNVVIQGDEQSEKLLYGAHIMIHSSTGDDSSIGRISYTEVRRAGQAYNLGRYPIHFHMIGNIRQSYVIGNAIHNTYNRAITIHGVHFFTVQKNVAYWCMGHTVFIEDGIETHNIIEDNLVMNTISSMALLNTDQTPASFWITNPNNVFRRNHAAGSDRYGFWFDLRKHPEGPSATTSICPTGERLGEFVDNQAHSSGRYGLRIFHELTPRTYPCLPYEPFDQNPPIQAEFKNFFGWKNMRSAIIGEKLGAIKFLNITAIDNLRCGVEITVGDFSPLGTLVLENAWIVGMSPENAGDANQYIDREVKGLITPKADNLIVKNIIFSNFGTKMPAIETCSHCEMSSSTDFGGRTTFFEGVRYNNVIQRVRFNEPFREILVDKDGSLTSNTAGGKGVVTFFRDHLDVPGCVRNEAVYNGLVCNENVMVRRVEFLDINPFDSFYVRNLTVERVEDNPTKKQTQMVYRHKPRKSWATPLATGYSYRLSWESRADFNNVTIKVPSPVFEVNDKTITLIFNHSAYRETYDVNTTDDVPRSIMNSTVLWDRTTGNTKNSGDWYHDVTNQLLYVAINGKNTQNLNLIAIKCREACRDPSAPVAKDGGVRLWSNVSQWPNQRLPQDGEDVEIPGEWIIKLDVSTASLGHVKIMGDLYFDSTKDNLVLTAKTIWVTGNLFIGNNTNERYTKKAKILLTGLRNTPSLMLGETRDASNKVLAVTGNVTMYGALVQNIYVRLQTPALPGALSITVPSTVDWKVGDEIMIAPSQRIPTEFETRTIQAISNGVITLDKAIDFYHFGASGATKETPYGTIDMRAEVGLLTRNIVIEGSDEDSWGARVYVGEVYNQEIEYYFRGRIDFDGVEMKNFGQKDTELAGLTFDRLTTNNNGASSVRRSVVRDSLGIEVNVIKSTNIILEDNIFYKSYRYQVRFDDENSKIKFSGNLIVGNQDRGVVNVEGNHANDVIIMFSAMFNFIDSEISNNTFAGCYDYCAVVKGGDCTTQTEGPYTFRNNVIHSGHSGWVVALANEKCTGASHFIGYRLHTGLVTAINSTRAKVSNVSITDSFVGVSLNMGEIEESTFSDLKDSYIGGLSISDVGAYFNETECSNLTGILVPISTNAKKNIPPKPFSLPWYKQKGSHTWQNTFTVTGVTFENFNNDVSGCVQNHILKTNPTASDASGSTRLSGLKLNNIGDDNKVLFVSNENNEDIGIDDCGGWYCTGLKNVMVRDLDGSLMGEPTSLFPKNPSVLDSKTCTINENENATICKQTGWGLLTFESLDDDAWTRIISPVNVSSSNGFTNLLNSYMDHIWDAFYTGLKRLSRFHSVVQSGRDYKIGFTGTVPKKLKWALQGAQDSENVTVEYGYANPQSVQVTKKDGTVINPTVIKSGDDKTMKLTDPCGKNLYNVDTRKIIVKLTGEESCVLRVELINSIRATVRYAITVEEFFSLNGQTAFIDRVAAVLKINPASIRVIEIRSGSSIVIADIISTHQDDTDESIANAKAELSQMIDKLTDAVKSGDLSVLNSQILDSSFGLALKAPTTTQPETISSGTNLLIIIIPVVVAVVGLAVGSYFAIRRYRRKRLLSVKVEQVKAPMKLSKLPSSTINMEGDIKTEGSQSMSPLRNRLNPSIIQSETISPVISPEMSASKRIETGTVGSNNNSPLNKGQKKNLLKLSTLEDQYNL